jgi:hypothetical protein
MAGPGKRHVLQTTGGKVTVEQLVRHAQKTSSEEFDPAWALTALSHYLSGNEEWKNAAGETWNLERLVKTQVSRPLSRGRGLTIAMIGLGKNGCCPAAS